MPSDRRQFNVRMNDDTAARVDRLLPVVARAVGLELTQAQFLALAVAALEAKHLVGDGGPTAPIQVTSAPRGRKKPKGADNNG